MTKNIYFDYQATTPLDPRVLERMLPFFGEIFGNPHSRNHSYGLVKKSARFYFCSTIIGSATIKLSSSSMLPTSSCGMRSTNLYMLA